MPNLTYRWSIILAALRAFLWSIYHNAGQMPRIVEAECRAALQAAKDDARAWERASDEVWMYYNAATNTIDAPSSKTATRSHARTVKARFNL